MPHVLGLEWWRREPGPQEMTGAAPALGEPTDGRVAFVALVGFTLVLVLQPQEYVPLLLQIRIAFLIGGFALAAGLFAGSKRPAALGAPVQFKLMLALVAWALLTMPMAMWPGGSFASLTDQYLKSVAICWLLGTVICSVSRLRFMAWTLALSSIPLALTGVKNYFAGAFVGTRVMGYAGGFATNPNDLALALNLFLPLTAALALTTERMWLRLVAWGTIGLSAIAIIVTFSRGGFLTLMTETALLLLLMMRRRAGMALGAMLLCGVLGLVMLPSDYADRVSTILNIESDPTYSAQIRWSDMQLATQYVMSHPLFGAGLSMDVLVLNEARGPLWARVHNSYLAHGVDLGLVGLVLYVALVATSFRSARRVERLPSASVGTELPTLAAGVRISLAGFIVAAFFYPVPYHYYFYYFAGLSVALRVIAARQFGIVT